MKKGEERRGEILACAEKLFYEKGYESTSIQDILDELHLSKGGFYHHFESKMQLLSAISEQKTAAQREAIDKAMEECTLEPAEKLNLLLEKSLPWRVEEMDFSGILLRVAYRDGELQIRESVKKALLDTVRPHLNRIILEGYEKKVFYSRYPDEIGELLLVLYANINDEIAGELAGAAEHEINVSAMLSHLEVCRYAMEQLLDAPYGSIRLFDVNTLPGILRKFNEQAKRFGENA